MVVLKVFVHCLVFSIAASSITLLVITHTVVTPGVYMELLYNIHVHLPASIICTIFHSGIDSESITEDTSELVIDTLLKCAPFSKPPSNVTVQGRTCEQVVNDKIVIAGAVSSNHFEEMKDMIASVQHFYPSLHIVIYNLGLRKEEVDDLESYCSVHVRQFNFNRYPDFVRNLFFFAWKPLVLQELSKNYEFIFYFDASIRLMKPVVDIVLPLMKEFPFVPGSAFRNVGEINSIRTTHDGMLQYLNITQSREELDAFGLVEGGVWAMWVNDLTVSKILEPWVDCALHKECIAPEGAQLIFCKEVKETDAKGAYRGCHRYDQSALNMILAREFGLSVWDLFPLREMRGILKIDRFPTKRYAIQVCHSRLYIH